MRRRIRAFLAAGVLVALLAGCRMDVTIGARINDGGSGTLSISMVMDREFFEGLSQRDPQRGKAGEGLASIKGLYDRLERAGWTVTRTQPSGGLSLDAAHSFANSGEFDALLSGLRSTNASDPVGGLKLSLDYGASHTFVRSRARFGGEIDLGSAVLGAAKDKRVAAALGEVLRFQIRAALPGGAEIVQGDGRIDGDSVVWEPALGQLMQFEARASHIKSSALLLLLLPLFGVVGAGAWFLLGRKKPRGATEQSTPDVVAS